MKLCIVFVVYSDGRPPAIVASGVNRDQAKSIAKALPMTGVKSVSVLETMHVYTNCAA